jgi:hypothetical protein
MLGLVLGTIGRRVLEKAFENSVKAIEARKGAARRQVHHEPGTRTLEFTLRCQQIRLRLK